jgi:hypothetical protein
MAGGFLSVRDAFAVGKDFFEKVCESFHVFISLLMGFAQGEKALAKFCNQVIDRVCNFIPCDDACWGKVVSMGV